MTLTILVLYDSRGGLTEHLGRAVAEGVGGVEGARARRLTIDEADQSELKRCDGLIVGSPNWSGMTGKLKDWFDYSGDLWQTGELAGKPAGAFTAGWTRSGGIEATLLQLLHLLLGHGMLVVGLPYTKAMRQSGSYYGATAHGNVTDEDLAQARVLGERVARTAAALERGRAG